MEIIDKNSSLNLFFKRIFTSSTEIATHKDDQILFLQGKFGTRHALFLGLVLEF